jgi:hypothetical protein
LTEIIAVLMERGSVFGGLRGNVRLFRRRASRLGRDALLRVARHVNLLPVPEKVFDQASAANAISYQIQVALSETLAKLTDIETQRDRWRDLARSGQARCAEMQAEIDQLKITIAVLAREQDEWKALAAKKPEASPPSDANYRRKFTKLRAVIVKSLHPDHGGGSQEERIMRGELFKRVWPEIERIESDAHSP